MRFYVRSQGVLYSSMRGDQTGVFPSLTDFGVEIRFRLEGQKARSEHVFARFVRLYAVGLDLVVGDGAEVFGVRHQRCVDFGNPLEPVIAGRAEHQFCLEVRVVQERPLEGFKVLNVVEVQTKVPAVLHQLVVGLLGEYSGESTVGEVGCHVVPPRVLVFDGAEFLGLGLGVVTGDVVPCIKQRDGLVGSLIGDRSLEEGEGGERIHRGRVAVVGAVAVLKMEVQAFVDDDEQILSVFLPVQLGEVEAVAFGDSVELVFVTGDFIGEFLFLVNLLRPNVEGLAAIGKRIPADAAVATGDFHHGLAGVELTQNVGIDSCAVVRLREDGFFTDHGVPPFLPVWVQESPSHALCRACGKRPHTRHWIQEGIPS